MEWRRAGRRTPAIRFPAGTHLPCPSIASALSVRAAYKSLRFLCFPQPTAALLAGTPTHRSLTNLFTRQPSSSLLKKSSYEQTFVLSTSFQLLPSY